MRERPLPYPILRAGQTAGTHARAELASAGLGYPPTVATRTCPMTESLAPSRLTHLQRLEAESIHILREVVAEATSP